MYQNSAKIVESFAELDDDERESLDSSSSPAVTEKSSTDPIIYSIRLKPLTWKEALDFLCNVNPDNVTTVRPQYPAGGRIYIYNATAHNFVKSSWRADGYTWDSTYGGANLYPSKTDKEECVVKKLIWPLYKADRRFVRYEWQLTDNCRQTLGLNITYVLVHYVGDEKVFVPKKSHTTQQTNIKNGSSIEPAHQKSNGAKTPDLILTGSQLQRFLLRSKKQLPLIKLGTPKKRKLDDSESSINSSNKSTSSTRSANSSVAAEHAYDAPISKNPTALNKNEPVWNQVESEFRMKMLAEEFELKKQLVKKKIEAAEAKKKYYEFMVNHALNQL